MRPGVHMPAPSESDFITSAFRKHAIQGLVRKRFLKGESLYLASSLVKRGCCLHNGMLTELGHQLRVLFLNPVPSVAPSSHLNSFRGGCRLTGLDGFRTSSFRAKPAFLREILAPF